MTKNQILNTKCEPKFFVAISNLKREEGYRIENTTKADLVFDIWVLVTGLLNEKNIYFHTKRLHYTIQGKVVLVL